MKIEIYIYLNIEKENQLTKKQKKNDIYFNEIIN